MEKKYMQVRSFECSECCEMLPIFESVTVEDEDGYMVCELCQEEWNLTDYIHQTMCPHTKIDYTPEQMVRRKGLIIPTQECIIEILKRRLTYK